MMPTKLSKILGLILVTSISAPGLAASGLCEDLAAFSCAPGTYDDGTGVVRDIGDANEQISAYADKTKKGLRADFEKVLADPDNTYFRESTLGALGLKDSPQCSSESAEDVKACNQNAVAGLVVVAQRQVFGDMASLGTRVRLGSVKDLLTVTVNDKFASVIDKYKVQAEKDLHSKDVIEKVENRVFPKVRALIAERINALPIPDQQKKYMIGKIKGINFKGTDCGMNMPGGKSDVSGLLVPNAFYNPANNTFKFCGGLLFEASSEFALAMIVAHELSHSIDPCNLANGANVGGFKYSSDELSSMEKEFPFNRVISCLRSPESVAAKNFGPVQQYVCQGCTSQTQATAQPPPKPNFCNNDQIGESFSDWIAAEIIPEYMEKNHKLTTKQYQTGYANTERLLCFESSSQLAAPSYFGGYGGYGAGMAQIQDVHPGPRDRINKILLANPKVRKQMGCPEKSSTTVYCDSERAISNGGDGKTEAGSKDPAEKVKEGVR